MILTNANFCPLTCSELSVVVESVQPKGVGLAQKSAPHELPYPGARPFYPLPSDILGVQVRSFGGFAVSHTFIESH
jgi:hypothetical protein